MRRMVYDWHAIQQYHVAGYDRDACMSRFGFAIAIWYKAIHETQLLARPMRSLVDWRDVQQYYDRGHTYGECRTKFGFASASWSSAVKRGLLKTRTHQLPQPNVVVRLKK